MVELHGYQVLVPDSVFYRDVDPIIYEGSMPADLRQIAIVDRIMAITKEDVVSHLKALASEIIDSPQLVADPSNRLEARLRMLPNRFIAEFAAGDSRWDNVIKRSTKALVSREKQRPEGKLRVRYGLLPAETLRYTDDERKYIATLTDGILKARNLGERLDLSLGIYDGLLPPFEHIKIMLRYCQKFGDALSFRGCPDLLQLELTHVVGVLYASFRTKESLQAVSDITPVMLEERCREGLEGLEVATKTYSDRRSDNGARWN